MKKVILLLVFLSLSACGVSGSIKTTNSDGGASASTSSNSVLIGGNTNGTDLSTGTTDSFAMNLITAGLPRLTVAANGNVGIGTITPASTLVVMKNSALAAPAEENQHATTTAHFVAEDDKMNFLTMDSFSNTAWKAPIIEFRRTLGSSTAPLNPNNFTGLGFIRGSGWVDTAYQSSTSILLTATEPWTSTARGSAIYFEVTPKGSTSTILPARIGDFNVHSLITLGSGRTKIIPWTTVEGANINVAPGTLTDSMGTGTVTTRTSTSFSQPTFASTNPMTLTNSANVYIAGPSIAGANTTITNAQSLHVASGVSYFGGSVGIGVQGPTYQLQLSTDSAAKPGTSSWTVASDQRLKDVTGSYSRGLESLLDLNTIYFNYKKSNALNLPSDKTYVGIEAQNLRENIPEAVTVDKKGFLQITTDAVIWTLVNSVKQLYHRLVSDKIELDHKISTLQELVQKQNQLIQNLQLKVELLELKQKSEMK